MAWVRFTADFDFKPKPTVTLAYLAGQVRNVPRACADLAVAKSKATRMKRPSRNSEPAEVSDDDDGRPAQ